MKEIFFNIVWSAILAWVVTRCAVAVEAKTQFGEMYFFPNIIDFIHGLGMSVKNVFFFLMTGIFMLGLGKIVGNILLTLLGVVIWVIIIGLVLLVIYKLLMWMAGTI